MTWKAVDLITSKTLCAVCEVWVYKERPVTECRHYGCVCALTATPTSLALCHCGQGAGLVPHRAGFKPWARWLLSPFPTRPLATSLLTTNIILKTLPHIWYIAVWQWDQMVLPRTMMRLISPLVLMSPHTAQSIIVLWIVVLSLIYEIQI